MKKKAFDKRTSNVSSVGDAISNMLKSYRLKGQFDEASVIASWEKLMGKPIASRTNKLFIKNHVLFVELNSAPLKHELNMSKSRILEIFQKEFGEGVINEILIM